VREEFIKAGEGVYREGEGLFQDGRRIRG